MPTFDYKCPKCGEEVKDKMVKSHSETVVCPNESCESEMKKQFSAPNIGGMDRFGRSK